MSDLYIDAQLLACPKGGSAAALQFYVSELLRVQSLVNRGFRNLLVSARAIEVLEVADSLPPWGESELDYFLQREDVNRLFYGLLGRLNTVEDFCRVLDVLIDEARCTCAFSSPDHALHADFHRCVAILALAADYALASLHAPCIVSPQTGYDPYMSTSGEIADAEFHDNAVGVRFPHSFSRKFKCAPNISSLSGVLDPTDLWLAGNYDLAIELAVFQRGASPQSNFDWSSPEQSFRVTPSFLRSAAEHGFCHIQARVDSLLRACAETILGAGLRDTHRIRIGRGGNSPQLIRSSDGAGAWRRDVDQEYHLHYWKSGAYVEFAAVVVHNDFSIPE